MYLNYLPVLTRLFSGQSGMTLSGASHLPLIYFKFEINTVGFHTLDPLRLGGRPYEVSGIDFIPNCGDYIQHSNSCFRQGIKQSIPAISRGIYSQITAWFLIGHKDFTFFGLELSPTPIIEISFEFRIDRS